MDTTSNYTITVPATHLIDKDKIVGLKAMIREDPTSGRQWYHLNTDGQATIVENDGDSGFTITLVRTTSGFFDGSRFSSGGENRGYVKLEFLH